MMAGNNSPESLDAIEVIFEHQQQFHERGPCDAS
jgi:hypothetical protein